MNKRLSIVLKEIVKTVIVFFFGLFRATHRKISKDKRVKRVLLFASKGACEKHIVEFAESIDQLGGLVRFDCLLIGVKKSDYPPICKQIRARILRSRWVAYSRHYDLVISAFGYSTSFRDKETKLLYTNHGAHIIGMNESEDTVTYTFVPKSKPNIMLEANRYKAEAIRSERPELRDVVKWVGWKFAEKEKKAEAERLSIRWKFGLNPSDVVVFIVGTWGPYNLYHTYGDRIFDVIRELAGHYKVIVSAHYNDFRKTRYYNGIDALPKGQMVEALEQCGCIVRKFYEPWIEYMAAADVVFTDYSTLSEEAVAMGKKVIFSNYPDTAVWKHSICYRARKYMPVVEDINRLGEYVDDALKMEIPEEVRKMAEETYVSRGEYEERVLELTKGLLELK